MVAPASRRISRVLRYSGFSPPVRPTGTGLSPLSSAFPDRSPSVSLVGARPCNPRAHVRRFRLLGFRSPLLAELSLFLALLRCFSSRTYPPLRDAPAQTGAGFPIRTSPLPSPAHGSAALFAVYHVLPRRQAARHPPDALLRLPRRAAETLTLSRVTSSLLSFACMRLLSCPEASLRRPPPASLPGRGGPTEARLHPRQKQPGIAQAVYTSSRLPVFAAILLCRPSPVVPNVSVLLAFTIFSFYRMSPHPVKVVEMRGLEPRTYALQRRRSPS